MAGIATADDAEEKLFEKKEGKGTRCKESKHSVGENLIIVRMAALDGGRGRRRRCCERESLRDKQGEGTRSQETKHSWVRK